MTFTGVPSTVTQRWCSRQSMSIHSRRRPRREASGRVVVGAAIVRMVDTRYLGESRAMADAPRISLGHAPAAGAPTDELELEQERAPPPPRPPPPARRPPAARGGAGAAAAPATGPPRQGPAGPPAGGRVRASGDR